MHGYCYFFVTAAVELQLILLGYVCTARFTAAYIANDASNVSDSLFFSLYSFLFFFLIIPRDLIHLVRSQFQWLLPATHFIVFLFFSIYLSILFSFFSKKTFTVFILPAIASGKGRHLRHSRRSNTLRERSRSWLKKEQKKKRNFQIELSVA